MLIVQPESDNCGPAAGCQANDFKTILTPTKMLLPCLLAWIEQRRVFARHWIKRVCFSALVAVAQRASQPKVLLTRGATGNVRDNVFYVQGHGRE